MKGCFFCFKKKKEIVIIRVEFFDERHKQIAKEVASKFPGVTEVVEVEGEGQLEVKGNFSSSELTKELKKIDKPVETNKIVTEPEVKIQQQDETVSQKASKPLNDGASSSKWTVSQRDSLWEQAKGLGAGAAEQAKIIGVGAAEKAVAIGVGAVKLLPNNMQPYYGNNNNKNYRKEIRAVKPQHWKEEEMRQNKIRQEKEEEKRRKQALAEEEEMKQKKIRQRKEEEKRKKQAIAEEERKQKRIMQEKEDEKRRKQGLENNSGGTSMVTGITGSLWNAAISTLTVASTQVLGNGQPSTSAQTQRTGQPNTTQNQVSRQQETRPVEKKGKNGR